MAPEIDEIELTEKAARPAPVTDKNKLSLLEDPFMPVEQTKEVISN